MGISPGFAPLRILSMNSGAREQRADVDGVSHQSARFDIIGPRIRRGHPGLRGEGDDALAVELKQGKGGHKHRFGLLGTASRSSSRAFPANPGMYNVDPVRLRPGRARLTARPNSTGLAT